MGASPWLKRASPAEFYRIMNNRKWQYPAQPKKQWQTPKKEKEKTKSHKEQKHKEQHETCTHKIINDRNRMNHVIIYLHPSPTPWSKLLVPQRRMARKNSK